MAAFLVLFAAQSREKPVTLTLNPTLNPPAKDYMVEVPASLVAKSAGNFIATYGQNTVPVEFVSNLRGERRAIFPVDVNGTTRVTLQEGDIPSYPKRSYAEIVHKTGGQWEGNKYIGPENWVKSNYMRKPDPCTDHSYYIKYEGPGWESDKVAYRFYLDWRNGIDLFAKKINDIVLPYIGAANYDSYHNMNYWGMDVLTVGNALGLGSIAFWDGTQAQRVAVTDSIITWIPADGRLRSQVRTHYYGWEANGTRTLLQSLISIDAGSFASHMELQADPSIPNLCTGIIKDAKAELITRSEPGSGWSYLATWGQQSLNKDLLGLAVFYRTAQCKQVTSDRLNHVVILTPDKGYTEYYFMGLWELDTEGIKTREAFVGYLDNYLARLNHPVKVAR